MGKQVKADGIFIDRNRQAYHLVNQFMRAQGATDLNYGCFTGGPSMPYSNEMHYQAVIWTGQHDGQMYVLVNAQTETGTRIEVTTSKLTPAVSKSLIDKLKENPLKSFQTQEVFDCAADDF